jgi:uncharacterized membrane protein YfcA
MPTAQAVSLALPLLLIGDIFALRLYWRDWDMRLIGLMLPMAALGVIGGSTLLASLPDIALRRILGGFALSFVFYKIASKQLPSVEYRPRHWHAYVSGAASGFGSALANTGSPPFTAYMLLQRDIKPTVFIGTATLFFAIINLLKLPGIVGADLLDWQQFRDILWAVPLIPISAWVGRLLTERINQQAFERLMLALLLVAGLALLFTAPK